MASFLSLFVTALLFMFMDVSNSEVYIQEANTGILCECAAFIRKGPEITIIDKTSKPLISQNPMNTTCDDAGKNTCTALCLELVKLGKEKAPQLLCAHILHAQYIKPSLFSRVCKTDWFYAGITAENNICCHDGKVFPCDNIILETE